MGHDVAVLLVLHVDNVHLPIHACIDAGEASRAPDNGSCEACSGHSRIPRKSCKSTAIGATTGCGPAALRPHRTLRNCVLVRVRYDAAVSSGSKWECKAGLETMYNLGGFINWRAVAQARRRTTSAAVSE